MPLAKNSLIKTCCSAMTGIQNNVFLRKTMCLCLTAHINPEKREKF